MRTRMIVMLAALAALGVTCGTRTDEHLLPAPAGVDRPDCTPGPGAPAIAITYIHFGNAPGSGFGPELEAAVWPDGRIVWAADTSDLGSDIREARIDPRQVSSLLDRVRAEQVFDEGAFRHSWFGPDSDYVVLQLVSGSECVRLRSWHEGFEGNPELVVVNGAGMSIGDESRETMSARSTPEWLHFLAVWRDVRSAVAGWIPATGVPCTEPVDLKGMR